MGQLLACMISRADLLGRALECEEASLAPPSKSSDGWGVGFYSDGEVLHKKRPQSPAPAQWSSMVEGLRSNVALVHVREATVGDARAENTHPFRMRQWLFAHSGSIGGFDAVRERLLESTPDFLRRNIRGETDSEHVFHVLLSFLHDGGHLDQVEAPDEAVVGAMRATAQLVDRLVSEVGAPLPGLNLAVTNGRHLYFLTRGEPACMVQRDHLPGRESDTDGRPAPSDPVRYALIAASIGDGPPPGYESLPAGQITVVDRDLQLHAHAL